MNEFIYVRDNVIPDFVCEELIRYYEDNKKERFENNLKPQFTQTTLSQNNSLMVLPYIENNIKEYKELFPYLPEPTNMELFRIKKYNPNTDDQFDWHCDAINKESSDRFLAILVYLNDVDYDGETEFQDLKIIPKEGSILIFPPFWTHPHRGLPVKGKSSKYIMSTYFRY